MQKYCAYCQNLIDENAQVCPVCGAAQQAGQQNYDYNQGYDPNGQYQQYDPNGQYQQYDPNGQYQQYDPNGQYQQYDPNGQYQQYDPNGQYQQYDPNGQYQQYDPNAQYQQASENVKAEKKVAKKQKAEKKPATEEKEPKSPLMKVVYGVLIALILLIVVAGLKGKGKDGQPAPTSAEPVESNKETIKVTEELQDAIDDYEEVEEMSKKIEDGQITLDGVVYQLPVPMSALIKDGWKIDAEDLEKTIRGHGTSFISISKEDYSLAEVVVKNISENEVTANYAFLCGITLTEENSAVKLAKGLKIGMSMEDFEYVLENFNCDITEKRKTTDYKATFDNGNSITVSVGKSSEVVEKISIDFSNIDELSDGEDSDDVEDEEEETDEEVKDKEDEDDEESYEDGDGDSEEVEEDEDDENIDEEE